jgi:mono/diheme cytochrome c family protein
MEKVMKIRAALAVMLLLASGLPVLADTAQSVPAAPRARPMQRGGLFSMQDGEAIYKGVCQGCHMPDAKGAVGAGAYPALA